MQETKPEEVILNCEKHGDFKQKSIEVLGKWMTFSKCTTCSKLENEEMELKREAEKKELDAHNRKAKRINAGISKRYLGIKFDDFSPLNEKQSKALKATKSLSESILSEKPAHSLIMSGGVGTGKTMLCSALIESLVSTKSCKIIKCIDLVRRLKSTWSKESAETEEKLIESYSNMDLLIIDEIGVQFGSDTEKLFIFDIIDGRYENMLPTVLISNQGMEKIKQLIGERVVDRLRDGGGKLLVLDGESFRK